MRLIVSSDNAAYPHVDYIGCVRRRVDGRARDVCDCRDCHAFINVMSSSRDLAMRKIREP